MLELFILLLIGVFAGLIAGLMGVGGGIIFTPVLFFLFENAGVQDPVVWTIGSGLFCTFIAAFGSTIRQHLQKNMFWREGLVLGLMGIIGVYVGKLLLTSKYYSEVEFAVFFSIVLFYAAFMMFKQGQDVQSESEREYRDLGIRKSFIAGGIGGIVASLAGVGGGSVMTPIMNLIYKQPFRKAVSISQLAMTIMIFSGWFQLAILDNTMPGITEFTLGFVDFGAALPLSLGGLVGGFTGAYLNQRINRKILQWGFALLAVIMAGRLLWGVL